MRHCCDNYRVLQVRRYYVNYRVLQLRLYYVNYRVLQARRCYDNYRVLQVSLLMTERTTAEMLITTSVTGEKLGLVVKH